MSELVHTFAGNPLDRGDAEAHDPEWLAAAAANPESRVLPLWRTKVLVDKTEEGQLQPRWLTNWRQFDALGERPLAFLGIHNDQAHFTVDITASSDEPPIEGEFMDCRGAAMSAEGSDAAIIGQARAMLEWNRNHAFCGRCAAATEPERACRVRVCSGCGKRHFPRTDPVVIMLIVDGERCLLGQPKGRMIGTNFYTALAGFVDHGESIEEAVRRETLEEAGVAVSAVRYHSSQPWPFPYSLMIGCHGDAASTDIQIDPSEMNDVRWFSRDEARASLEGKTDITVPGPIAIAHHLIRTWVYDK